MGGSGRGCPECSDTVNYNTKSMSPSKTPRKIYNLKEDLQTTSVFFKQILIRSLSSQARQPSQPAEPARHPSQPAKGSQTRDLSQGFSDKGSQPKDLSQEISKDTVWGLTLESYCEMDGR